MTDTILLVGHGSREQSGNDEIETFAQQWRTRRPDWRIEVCFIEFSDITLGRREGRVGLASFSVGSATMRPRASCQR